MNRCVQEPQIFGKDGESSMSDDVMADAMELFRSGDLKGAVENLDGKLRSNRDNAILQHTFAEFANMLNMEEQEDVVPGTKIMMSYKKAMELDEENDEYIADFASFALECRRVPKRLRNSNGTVAVLRWPISLRMMFFTWLHEILSIPSK
jgi:Tfp pilus assembly protein PilF